MLLSRISRSAVSAASAVRTAGVSRGLHATRVASAVYDNILETVGSTPVVRINKLGPEGINLFAKCEYFNPLSSVKDRLALGIIEHAERTGALKPGQTVVEATSGNTGIAVAMVCAAKGYPCVVTMAESFSVERRKVMRMLGAKVVLTPAAERGTGMVKKAKELADAHGWFLTSQFEHEANPEYHANTTGPEILSDFRGKGLDYWVTGYGTGGTLQGVGKVLRAARPDCKVVVSEPSGAALLQSGSPTERNADGSPASTHPAWAPHPIQGWTPDFVSKITEDAQSMDLIDDVRSIDGDVAIQTAHRLAREEGIFTGISGGATMATALEVASNAPKGSTVLCMIPDTGERYLSTPLFADIEADMNEGELAISESTPSGHVTPA